MPPLFLPQRLYDQAKADPRYKAACERGDLRPVPTWPKLAEVYEVYRR